MRCRGCNAEMAHFMRKVKEGDEVFEVEEDLCTICRGEVYGFSKSYWMENDPQNDILPSFGYWESQLDFMLTHTRKRGSGCDDSD